MGTISASARGMLADEPITSTRDWRWIDPEGPLTRYEVQALDCLSIHADQDGLVAMGYGTLGVRAGLKKGLAHRATRALCGRYAIRTVQRGDGAHLSTTWRVLRTVEELADRFGLALGVRI